MRCSYSRAIASHHHHGTLFVPRLSSHESAAVLLAFQRSACIAAATYPATPRRVSGLRHDADGSRSQVFRAQGNSIPGQNAGLTRAFVYSAERLCTVDTAGHIEKVQRRRATRHDQVAFARIRLLHQLEAVVKLDMGCLAIISACSHVSHKQELKAAILQPRATQCKAQMLPLEVRTRTIVPCAFSFTTTTANKSHL